MDPARAAVIDEAHCRKVNREIFFLADEAELAAFDRNPLKYAGILTDPVSGERFDPGDAPGEATWDGRRWYFSTDETLGKFLADPAKYAVQENVMLPEREPAPGSAPAPVQEGSEGSPLESPASTPAPGMSSNG